MSKVIVLLTNEVDGHVYEGNYRVDLSPANALIVLEDVPNVTGKGSDTVPHIRSIYNTNRWDQVGVS
jgi:hypothetical protein